MRHTLYIIHGSHPCICAETALRLKRQPYRRVEFPPVLHVPVLWLRYRHTTVPVLRLAGGEPVLGSRAIVHRLDELVPDPPLLPADPAERERVEAAERWGDDVLQAMTRRLFWAALKARPRAISTYTPGSRLPIPPAVQRFAAPALTRFASHYNKVAEHAAEDFPALVAQLDQVDAWIVEGLIGGARPNAADLQLAPSLRMLGSFGDVRPLLESRPCWAFAKRIVPVYDGDIPAGALIS
jgi:glutathione S-transferase